MPSLIEKADNDDTRACLVLLLGHHAREWPDRARFASFLESTLPALRLAGAHAVLLSGPASCEECALSTLFDSLDGTPPFGSGFRSDMWPSEDPERLAFETIARLDARLRPRVLELMKQRERRVDSMTLKSVAVDCLPWVFDPKALPTAWNALSERQVELLTWVAREPQLAVLSDVLTAILRSLHYQDEDALKRKLGLKIWKQVQAELTRHPSDERVKRINQGIYTAHRKACIDPNIPRKSWWRRFFFGGD